MEQNHHQSLVSEKFEVKEGVSKCRNCGKEKSKHIVVLNCPCPELKTEATRKCFRCQKFFSLEYVLPKKDYSFKNNWDYWTEKEENKGKYICNSCLLFLCRKDKKHFLREVQSKKKRNLFRTYVYDKTIS